MIKGITILEHKKQKLLEIDTDIIKLGKTLSWGDKKIIVGEGMMNSEEREDKTPMHRYLYYNKNSTQKCLPLTN